MGHAETANIEFVMQADFIMVTRAWSEEFGPNMDDRLNQGLLYIDIVLARIRECEGFPPESVPSKAGWRLPLAGKVLVEYRVEEVFARESERLICCV